MWREATKRLALTPKHRRCPWAIKLQFLRSFELSTEPCCISRLRETKADIFGANGQLIVEASQFHSSTTKKAKEKRTLVRKKAREPFAVRRNAPSEPYRAPDEPSQERPGQRVTIGSIVDPQRLFDQYNAKYFAGRLPRYQILRTERYGKGDHGLCRKKQREIHLGTLLRGARLGEVLLHEMVHAATRSGHGRAWQAEMLRLAEMGAPTRRDLLAYQDPDQTITWSEILNEARDACFETDLSWREMRAQIGLRYGLTDRQGRSESPGAAKRMQQLRQEFIKGRREWISRAE